MDFNNTGAMRSPFSPRVRQSIAGRRPIGISSAKKNQSKFMQSPGDQPGDVIYKTPMCTVETYGMPLPVMVTETLTFASGDVTVRLSPCGWCWVVSGRRVLAWARSAPSPTGTASPAPTGPHAARELTLPQTDLAHKADLVVLFYEDGAQMPSCIGVSPEGVVRYWASIGQEGVYVDVSCELAGQECERLGEYTRAGLVLATTTCTVVLLNPTIVEGRPTVTCRTLRPPSGWLGGIGRRVSLLFFGSMPAHGDTKLVGAVVVSEGDGEGQGQCIALVAGGPVLQLWRGAELHEHSLRRALSDALMRPLMPHAPCGDLNSLEIMALDVRASGANGLLLLIAAVNVARSPEMRYAIAHISVEDPTSPRVTSLVALRSWAHDAQEAPRFLPLPLALHAVLYTTKYIALVSTSMSNDKVDYIDVSSEGDRILGAELCHGVPLMFSRKHGVLALTTTESLAPTPSGCDSPMGSPCPSDMYDGNLSLYEIDPHEVNMVTTDACGKLKTAFLFHLRRDTTACGKLLHELFPPPVQVQVQAQAQHPQAPRGEPAEEKDVDSVLDRTVMKIATEMLDDIPAGDPRWKQRTGGPQTNIALGSSAALQIAAQLRDKQRAFSLFVEFLRAAGLWRRLGLVSAEGGGVVSTESALGELAEQLATAVALRRLQQGEHAQIVDAAVYQVVCGDNPEVEEEPEVEEALASGALSASDACYRRVSRVSRVLRALARSRPASQALHVLVSVLTEVHRVRAQWQAPPPPPLGPRALLPALTDLHKRAIAECGQGLQGGAGAGAGAGAGQRARVLEAAAALADLILTEAAPLQRDAHTQHLYERIRRGTIQPFLDEGQTERAATLAEKFQDFELLVEMCVEKNDLERLYTYIDKYSNEGVGEIAFAWLASRGGAYSATLIRALGARYPSRVAAWLRVSPQRMPLLALHHLAQPRYERAAAVLADMALEETDSVERMTTMASLAKLCLVAAEGPECARCVTWQRAERRLSVGAQHAALPRALRLRHGLDAEDTRVLPPEDLVQMYVESDCTSLTEYDYKKALDLTDFIEDMELRDDLRLRVWCACVLRDEWTARRVDAPHDELRDKMFFRLIDLVHLMGGDLELVLPPAEDILTAPELAELASDPRFHFIIKYGYECLDTTRNGSLIET